MKQRFNACVRRAEEGFVAQCVEIDHASHGRTEDEALANLREALERYLNPPPATAQSRLASIEVEVERCADFWTLSRRENSSDRALELGEMLSGAPLAEKIDSPLRSPRLVCPRCDSTAVRRANDQEMEAFYHGPSFVVRPPWRCVSCGCTWEESPTPTEARMMTVLSVGGLVAAGVMFTAAIMGVVLVILGHRAWRLPTIAVASVACFSASLTAFRRYRRYLRKHRAS